MHTHVAAVLPALAGLTLLACSSSPVGAPCLPEQVPEQGFDAKEAYVESSSLQCETRTCLVFRLEGDPRESCAQSGDGKGCATPEDIADRIYCTCRCDSADTGLEECECPDGFTCVDVLEHGDRGQRGGYCVMNNTF